VGAVDATGKVTEVSVFPGLTRGATITVIQTVCGKASKAGQAVVGPAPENILTPEVLPAFANELSVVVTRIVPGAIIEISENSVYNQIVARVCSVDMTTSIRIGFPLFAGAQLQARQTLCKQTGLSPTVTVSQPKEWPLGQGPFKAGFRLVSDVPISPSIMYRGSAEGPCLGAADDLHHFKRPAANQAVIFYPATMDGEDTPVAGGGPFHVLVFGQGRRKPSCLGGWQACPGAPTETDTDFRQFSGILSHLARWGFVSIAADFAWLAGTFSVADWMLALADSASYLIGENTRAGSSLQGQLVTSSVNLMGHSTNGWAAVLLATNGSLPVDSLALLAPAGGENEIVNFAPKPVILLHGTRDLSGLGDSGHSLNVYAAAAATKHLVDIEGANHFGFTDSLCVQVDATATMAQADQQRIAMAYLTAFLRRYGTNAPNLDDYLSGQRPIEELETFVIAVNSQL
jgi:pimeloyl-ACP methyl ester carboxylesterase